MVNIQTFIFLRAFLLGACLGLLYDVFRILRIAIKTPAVIVFLEDILYFLICGIITFLFMMSCIDGRVRGFIVIGELLGAVLYYCTIGSLLFRLSNAIIYAVKKFFRLIFHPVFLLLGWISSILKKTGKFIGFNIKKYRKKLNFHLKAEGVLLYNISIRQKRKTVSDQPHSEIKRKEKRHEKKHRKKAASVF